MKCYKNHAGEFVEVCSRRLQPHKTRGRTHLSAALPQQHLPAKSGSYHITSRGLGWAGEAIDTPDWEASSWILKATW